MGREKNGENGKTFEKEITELINNGTVVPSLTSEYAEDAYEKYFRKYKKAKWIGGSYKKSGDLIVYDENGKSKSVELKITADGAKGTWMSTTMEYFKNALDFEDFVSFLSKYGYYDFLESLGLHPDRKNLSPFTYDESENIRNNLSLYEKIIAEEGEIREKYVTYLFGELQKDETKCRTFEKDMITKSAADKEIPDEVFIYNRKKNNFVIIKKEDISSEYFPISRVGKEYSICFGDFRATMAWQNGTGLYNPTIRVFMK
jgi:hypothetical protein